MVIKELLQELGSSIASHAQQGLDGIETLELGGAVHVGRGHEAVVQRPGLSVYIILQKNLSSFQSLVISFVCGKSDDENSIC